LERVRRSCSFWLPLTIVAALFLALTAWTQRSLAQGAAQPTYASAEQATQALRDAVQNDNEQVILQVLGCRKELASSGDGLRDKAERKEFATKYQEMHRLVREADGSTVLYIGAENWPFPIPLISVKGKWRFDADRGKKEIVFRRIGENEAAAIQACHASVRAMRGYTSEPDGDNAATRHPQTLVTSQPGGSSSTPGKAQGTSAPFNGYYFRQVSNDSDIADGAVVFVAYPAEYRSSGVMTFAVTADDVVFENDLGPNTARVAKAISKETPDLTWHLAE
jgi:hypothetical protein